MASARAPGWVDLLSSGVMLCFKPDTPEEFVAAMQVVKGWPLDALPDGTELNDTIFNNIRFLCRAILRPYLEHRLLETAASPDDGQIPLLVFKTPLAMCRVIKHIATHERFPTDDELHNYDATFAVTNDASTIADVKEGARRRGVPESDCLGAVIYLSPPGGGFSSDIAWPLESWRVMIPRASAA
jgi:hypothetical protein